MCVPRTACAWYDWDEVPVLWHMLAEHLEEHQQVEAAGPSLNPKLEAKLKP